MPETRPPHIRRNSQLQKVSSLTARKYPSAEPNMKSPVVRLKDLNIPVKTLLRLRLRATRVNRRVMFCSARRLNKHPQAEDCGGYSGGLFSASCAPGGFSTSGTTDYVGYAQNKHGCQRPSATLDTIGPVTFEVPSASAAGQQRVGGSSLAARTDG